MIFRSIAYPFVFSVLSDSRCENIWLKWLSDWKVVESVSVGRVNMSSCNWLNYLGSGHAWLGDLSCGHFSISPHFVCEQVNSIWDWDFSLDDSFLDKSSGISEGKISLVDSGWERLWESSLLRVVFNCINDVLDHVSLIGAYSESRVRSIKILSCITSSRHESSSRIWWMVICEVLIHPNFTLPLVVKSN